VEKWKKKAQNLKGWWGERGGQKVSRTLEAVEKKSFWGRGKRRGGSGLRGSGGKNRGLSCKGGPKVAQWSFPQDKGKASECDNHR